MDPQRLRSRALHVALALAFVVAWTRPMWAQLLSPGDLAAPHAKLSGDDNCTKCHSSGRRVSTSACTGCHSDIRAARASKRGMHGTVWASQGCPTCHTDHRGAGFQLVRLDRKSFPHAQTGFALQGAHAKADCAGCHKGGKWMGVTRSCDGCHKDAHAGRLGKACSGCHEETKWSAVHLDGFDHGRARFPLRGAHGKVACDRCHGTPGKYQGIAFSACTSCHDDPHKGRLSSACTDCHTEATWRTVKMKSGAHPVLSLANGHAKVDCARCHDKGNLARPSRSPACVSCHANVHDAPFGTRCESCHFNIVWRGVPRKIALRAHGKTPFALEGAHTNVACKSCHLPTLSVSHRYRQLEFERCTSCHDDPHGGEFANRGQGECAACHQVAGFAPTTFGTVEHATTGFPLLGRHQAAPCSACHHTTEAGKPRLTWGGADAACAKCHENPHGSDFAATIRTKGCGSCHSAVGWDMPNIAHDKWPLTGAHAGAPCDRCHQAKPKGPKGKSQARFQNTPRACEGCHTDAHAGQFRLSKPKRACDDCHETASFTIPKFDHAARAGFELEGRHRDLPCDKCHGKEKLAKGSPVTRYRLGYRRCQDCHADPHSGAGP